jgi:predicted ester cyclase
MTSEPGTTLDSLGDLRSGMTRAEIVEMFKRRELAYDDLDARALAADYADDAVIESPIAGVHDGRAAERWLRKAFNAFMDLTKGPDELVIDGDVVVTIANFEGTLMQEFLGLEPTGKRFQMSVAFMHRLRDGKIVHERRIYDFTGLLLQIGLLKSKPA